MSVSRRNFLSATVATLASLTSCNKARELPKQEAVRDPEAVPKNELDEANATFLKGNYNEAIDRYSDLLEKRPDIQDDLRLGIACGYVRLGLPEKATAAIGNVKSKTADDLTLAAWIRATAGDFDGASQAMSQLSETDVADDIELFAQLAMAAARSGNRKEAWHYFRLIQKNDPSSAAIDRLTESGHFNFTSEWFGKGPTSLWNYSKGFGSGVVGWTVDLAKGLWQLFRHPIDTVSSVAGAIADICTAENLKLLFSPRQLAAVLGDVIARLYWSAWEACKLSAVRQFGLDADRFEDQQSIHEIAAGRMIGYVAPDLVLIVLSAGAGAVAKAGEAERAIAMAKTVAQTESRLETINQIARSTRFLEDAEKWPLLRRIHWLSEETWEALKASPRTASRIELVLDHISAVRHIPGAESLVKTITGRLKLDCTF